MNPFTRNIILEKFNQRKSTNKHYSLRAFARDLTVSPSLISRVINGHIPLSLSMLNQIRPTLGLSEKEYDVIKNEIIHFDRSSRATILTDEERILLESLSSLKQYGWLPFALLEMINLCHRDVFLVAEKLQIDRVELQSVLDEMVEKKIIFLKGNLYKVYPTVQKILSKELDAALMEDKAVYMLKKISADIDQREEIALGVMSTTICVDSDLIPELRKKIIKLEKGIVKYIKKNSKKKDIPYELNINFVPWW